MNTIKIINPAAGQGRAVDQIPGNERYYVSKYVGDVERFVYETLLTEPQTHFIICGGDGTINEAVNGVIRAGAGETALLSAVAAGTGNDFLKYDNYTESPVKCDVIKYNDRYYLNILNIGFDCAVVIKTDELKKKPLISGSFAYLCGVASTLTRKYGTVLKLTLRMQDGTVEEYEDDYMLCVAANASWYGGGFKPAPLADVSDGLIDIVTVKTIPRTRIPSIIGAYKKGAHIDAETAAVVDRFSDVISYKRCVSATISGMEKLCVDGEIESCGSVELSVVPKAVNFLF